MHEQTNATGGSNAVAGALMQPATSCALIEAAPQAADTSSRQGSDAVVAASQVTSADTAATASAAPQQPTSPVEVSADQISARMAAIEACPGASENAVAGAPHGLKGTGQSDIPAATLAQGSDVHSTAVKRNLISSAQQSVSQLTSKAPARPQLMANTSVTRRAAQARTAAEIRGNKAPQVCCGAIFAHCA